MFLPLQPRPLYVRTVVVPELLQLRGFSMKHTIIVLLALLLPMLMGVHSGLAQQSPNNNEKSLEELLQQLAADAAKGYVAPIVSGFGSDLNAGWFHRAPRATLFGFDLEFGLVAMATFFKDEDKVFSTSSVFQFDSSQAAMLTEFIRDDPQYGTTEQQRANVQRATIQQLRGRDFTVGVAGPTVIGKKEDSVRVQFHGTTVTVTDPNTGQSRQITVPAEHIPLPVTGLLEDAPALPLASPQLTIGTILGSQFTLRYLPEVELDEEIGRFKYVGYGVQHNPAVWFGEDTLPFEIALGYFTQRMSVGTLFEATATTFGVNASKRLGWGALNLTPYAGFMVERSSMTFTYDYEIDTPTGPVPRNVRFELEGGNKRRVTAGLSLKFLIVNVNADYNWGTYRSMSAGLMIII
jgi:hypothetical protein